MKKTGSLYPGNPAVVSVPMYHPAAIFNKKTQLNENVK
jgi:hypothetical protein